jgi:hypothetical protein
LALMPALGESRAEAADVYQLAVNRTVELVSGTQAERLFLPGDPWDAVDDNLQAICSSPESIEAFVNFARAKPAP